MQNSRSGALRVVFSLIFVLAAGVILYKTVFSASNQTTIPASQPADNEQPKVATEDKSYDQYSFQDLKYISSRLSSEASMS